VDQPKTEAHHFGSSSQPNTTATPEAAPLDDDQSINTFGFSDEFEDDIPDYVDEEEM
jgi:hypothetical protein